MSLNKKLNRSEAGYLGYLKSKEKREAKNKKNQDLYFENPKYCATCENILAFKKRKDKFCSRSCFITLNNKNRGLQNKKYNKCQNCEKHANKIFCSLKCHVDFKWKIKKLEIESSNCFKRVISIGYAKKYLIEKNGHCCQICETKEWCGKPIPLIMDHIDGDSTNNTILNIRLVCGNCDMQLPTYKNKNKGSGRASRRERYRLKKTY